MKRYDTAGLLLYFYYSNVISNIFSKVVLLENHIINRSIITKLDMIDIYALGV